MQSILLTVKRLLGIHADDESFDINVVIYINTALSSLCQLGFGPTDGFIVTSENDTWSDIIGDVKDAEFVKTYVVLKTKLLFDPPTSSAAIEAINRTISELEWRITNLNSKGVV